MHIWRGNPFRASIRLYFRFIDDLIFIMDDGTSSLTPFLTFLEYLNCNNKNLTFTGEANDRQTHFLDVLLTGADRKG